MCMLAQVLKAITFREQPPATRRGVFTRHVTAFWVDVWRSLDSACPPENKFVAPCAETTTTGRFDVFADEGKVYAGHEPTNEICICGFVWITAKPIVDIVIET
jgi:hypothetical protein